MYGCDKCEQIFWTKRAKNIHRTKGHHLQVPEKKVKQIVNVPDLFALGIVKRKLTRKEAIDLTKEVMSYGFKDPNIRFNLAMVKAIEICSEKLE